MITYSAAAYWVDAIIGTAPQTRGPGEYFPAMEEARLATRRNRVQSVWAVLAGAPRLVVGLVAKLVPTSIKTALTAQAEARQLDRDFKRLEDLGPHLLNDIGIEQTAEDLYVLIQTGAPVIQGPVVEPDTFVAPAAPAVRAVKAAPKRAWQPSAGLLPA